MVHEDHEAPESLDSSDVPGKDLLPAARSCEPSLTLFNRSALFSWELVQVPERILVHMQLSCAPA